MARKDALERQRHPRAEADEEDAALSAFNSSCLGVAQGRFPQLADREDLWRGEIRGRESFCSP